jgi:RNA polymerase sigma factor (sigma-70 family)
MIQNGMTLNSAFSPEHWQTFLLRYALRVPLPYDVAEDLVQDTFLELFQTLHAGKQIEYPKAWTLCVLRRSILKRLRFEARFESIEGQERIYDPRNLLNNTLLVWGFLELLSSRERQVLLLRLRDWKHKEIAERLCVSMNTVDTLIKRALRKIRDALGENC